MNIIYVLTVSIKFDHIFLGPQRRDYLEYKFGTVSISLKHRISIYKWRKQIKSYNGRNCFVLPFIIRM